MIIRVSGIRECVCMPEILGPVTMKASDYICRELGFMQDRGRDCKMHSPLEDT